MTAAEDPSCYGCSQGWCPGHCLFCGCFADIEYPDEGCEDVECECHEEGEE